MSGIEGVNGEALTVELPFGAARTTIKPNRNNGWFSIGAQSGALLVIAAGSPLFSFRNTSQKFINVNRVGIGLIATTAFTAAQKVDFGLIIGRGYTVGDSGGTPIAMTNDNGKYRKTMTALNSVDMRIAAAATLTAGTRTLDANDVSIVTGWAPTTAGVIVPSSGNNLFSHDAGDYPLVLAPQEALIIRNITALGAVGVTNLLVNLEFYETDD